MDITWYLFTEIYGVPYEKDSEPLNLKTMHFLILGATGKSGAYAYKYALEQGESALYGTLLLLQVDIITGFFF